MEMQTPTKQDLGNRVTDLSMKIYESDKILLQKASQKLGIGISTFCRMAGLERARQILFKQQGGVQ